ncbi:MAG: holo-ACP synthase [Selenomonadaceae bacterium]|nr:holo-ACP synthase [Selenomonadaceae bacterium]MBR3723514.1 holo-ACP synthase [Selenomonadaceae bacterium]
MIIGVGTDICSVRRIEKAIEREEFVRRVYTIGEICYCKARKKSGAASFAARFAAKEAVLKAFGTGLRIGKMTDVEVIVDKLGAPHIQLHGEIMSFAEEKKVKEIHLSLSHEYDYATAFCVMEGYDENSFKG